MKIKTVLVKYKNTPVAKKDMKFMKRIGWVNWNCKDSYLNTRTKKFIKLLSVITSKYILENYQVLFSNEKPIKGQIYDTLTLIDDDNNQILKVTIGESLKQKYSIYIGNQPIRFSKIADLNCFFMQINQSIASKNDLSNLLQTKIKKERILKN